MKKLYLLSIAAISLFAACNDEITEVNETTEVVGIQMIAAGAELDSCVKENAGTMVYVADSNAVYYCAENKWLPMGGASKDSVFIVKYDSVVVTKVDTVVVRDTLVGLNGASCSAEKIESGYKIVCGGDSVGVVLNGAVGDSGKSGNDGKDACNLEDDLNGTITITCGSGDNEKKTKMFKALCKGAAYDPANKECVDEGLLKVCADTLEGSVNKNSNGLFYTCLSRKWKSATEEEVVVGKSCMDKNLGEIADGNDGEKWTCRSSAWDKSTELELAIGKSCTSLNQDEQVLLDYSNWVCRADSIGWVYDFANLNYGSVLYAGKAYVTVGIGKQMWFAENLNYATTGGNADNGVGSWCYNNSASNCSIYGRLYTWAAAMDLPAEYNSKSAAEVVSEKHQGVCPTGWHVPTDDEWTQLGEFVDKYNGDEGVGVSLKGKQYWPVKAGTSPGSDKFGFNALAGGYLNPSAGKFVTIYGETVPTASFITATELEDAVWMKSRDLSLETATFNGINDQDWKTLASSLRCLKD